MTITPSAAPRCRDVTTGANERIPQDSGTERDIKNNRLHYPPVQRQGVPIVSHNQILTRELVDRYVNSRFPIRVQSVCRPLWFARLSRLLPLSIPSLRAQLDNWQKLRTPEAVSLKQARPLTKKPVSVPAPVRTPAPVAAPVPVRVPAPVTTAVPALIIPAAADTTAAELAAILPLAQTAAAHPTPFPLPPIQR
ncbi:hypothetical protein BC937DRAFT_92713 [Endogone sp. FLAS-F59071]|nr:hypothetical protein BC937DRAFT_92713 [Endogone sp. FLAS-F59071]|eukprot:RUS15240.1 hypothetical protein BC937DRAFT_92713 [Endogone sp. FLAS-F59071]